MADTRGMKAKALARYGRVAEEFAAAGKAELRVTAPHKSYELRDSIRATTVRSGATTFRTTFEAPVIQAATTNSGARPHVIRPRSGKVLSFYWPKVGKRVALRYVNHPGNRGTHWWDKVLEQHGRILSSVLRRV